jgi:cellulose synthase/poly-beta-1,6-N-acetylglucosamine synthase-like glycosyltransferase
MITNILLLTKGYNSGYLPKSDYPMVQPFFPAANIAIRKTVLDEIGLFDTACKTSGEDLDLCIRAAKTKWELFFEPRAIVSHKHRTTLRGLLKQWYGYGIYHAYVFKKHTPKCIQIHYRDDKSAVGWSSIRISRIFTLLFPVRILIFITPFHALNMFFILALFSLIIKSQALLMAASGGWIAGWLYFSDKSFFKNVVLKRNLRWIAYSMFRYVLNWTYVLGAFLSGLKIGVISIESTREHTPSN